MSSPNHAELRSSLQVLTSYVALDKEMTCRHAQWLIVIKKKANSRRPLRPKAATRHGLRPLTPEPGTPALTPTANPRTRHPAWTPTANPGTWQPGTDPDR